MEKRFSLSNCLLEADQDVCAGSLTHVCSAQCGHSEWGVINVDSSYKLISAEWR